MSLFNPGNVPVAARTLADIERNSIIEEIPEYDLTDALKSKTIAPYDETIIWARPTLRKYKDVWQAASRKGWVEPLENIDTFTGTVDIDHVFPKSWTKLDIYLVSYVRIFPVWREVNRSAGGGRERLDPHAPDYIPNELREGIYYATDLQLRKMLNHPPGTTKDRSNLFD